MRKFYLLIGFCFVFYAVQAQPIISNVAPSVGDVIQINFSEEMVDPGSSGADLTWDFSDFSINMYSGGYIVLDPAEVEGAEEFPEATRVMFMDAGFMAMRNYVSFDNNAFTDYGTLSEDGSFGTIYDNPKTHFEYPVNYLDTGEDTYSGLVLVGGFSNSPISGEYSYEVDGYGTLITPYGSFANTLRYKVIATESLSTFGFTTTTLITEYYWYSDEYPFPVFTIHQDVSFSNSIPIDSAYSVTAMVSYQSGTTGVNTLNADRSITISPNPANSFVAIDYDDHQPAIVRFYNSTGKVILEKSIQSAESVDVSSLSTGIYIAEILIDGELCGRRSFIKQ